MIHDDIVAQLMFGTWTTIVYPVSGGSATRQQRLWREAIAQALPRAPSDDAGRHRLGQQLNTLRKLRNRVAHHDNLLRVNVKGRANGMLSVLAQIDEQLPNLAAAKRALRRLANEDPRRHW